MNNKELVWKNIRLKPYEKRDFDFVYKCYQDYDSRPLFTNDFNIISRDEFVDYIDKKANYSFHDFMIIICRHQALHSPTGETEEDRAQ